MSTFNKVLQFLIGIAVWLGLRTVVGIVALPLLAIVLPESLLVLALFIVMVYAFAINNKGAAFYRGICSVIFEYVLRCVRHIKAALRRHELARAGFQPI